MAKKKSVSKKSKGLSILKKRMAKKKTTRRRRTVSAAAPKRRRRRRSMSAGSGMMASLKTNMSGAAGGLAYVGLGMLTKKPMYRLIGGVAMSVGLAMFMNPYMGAGAMGATVSDGVKPLLSKFGLADDLEDMDYVPADTLEDTGYMDDDGNEILQDSDGVVYQLSEDGSYTAVGDVYDLEDAYALSDSMQNVSMLPL